MNKLLLPMSVLILSLQALAYTHATTAPDYDAIDYGNECRYTTCTTTSDEVDNPFK